MHRGSMLELLETLESCLNGKHDLAKLLEADAGLDSSYVARWCRHCGAAVVDFDYDNRTNAGQVVSMHSPEFVRQAIALFYRQLLREIITTLCADRVYYYFGKGYGHSALKAMVEGEAQIPAEVAAKISFLAVVITHLEGAYTNDGVCAWFQRSRVQLGDKSPAEILSGDWSPEAESAQRILELARSLSSSPAT